MQAEAELPLNQVRSRKDLCQMGQLLARSVQTDSTKEEAISPKLSQKMGPCIRQECPPLVVFPLEKTLSRL